jgi:hypothetical protein
VCRDGNGAVFGSELHGFQVQRVRVRFPPNGFRVQGPGTYQVRFWVSIFIRGCPMEVEIEHFE